MNSGVLVQQSILPWDAASDADRLFRRVLLSALGILLVLSVTLPLLPLQALQKIRARLEEEQVWAQLLRKLRKPPKEASEGAPERGEKKANGVPKEP